MKDVGDPGVVMFVRLVDTQLLHLDAHDDLLKPTPCFSPQRSIQPHVLVTNLVRLGPQAIVQEGL
eukprot:47235-Eustigmatos_ZCMA.PRE.1